MITESLIIRLIEKIDYTFQYLGIHRIIATCTEKNVASFKVMEKCSMVEINT